MSGPVKIVAAEASARIALAQSSPVVKPEVLQPKLATDVRTPEFKLEVKAEAV